MPLEERDLIRLVDIQFYSRKAIEILGDHDDDAAAADVTVLFALIHCISVIGEAGRRVSATCQSQLPAIPWHLMYGMRNRLVHDYGNTDPQRVIEVVRHQLPDLLSVGKHPTEPMTSLEPHRLRSAA